MKRKTTTWLRDHAVDGLFLQSWDRNGACGYWIVDLNRTVMANGRFDSSLLQHPIPRLTRLEQLHHDERERITSWNAGVAAADTCSVDVALNTNWMRRTG
jgi:hypothetical protein